MTDLVHEARLNEQSRVVIPAAVRRRLGVGPGDRVIFVVGDDDSVRLVSVRALVEAVWANNRVQVEVDTDAWHDPVRQARDDDIAMEEQAQQEMDEQAVADTRSPEEVTAQLYAQLGRQWPIF